MKSLEARALTLLAMREHSQYELNEKLQKHSQSCSGDLAELLAKLKAEGLQCDQRYAEAYVRARVEQGMGPLKIRAALAARGVSATLIERVLQAYEPEWQTLLQRVVDKKYDAQCECTHQQKQRMFRFLIQRGFTPDQVRHHIFRVMPSIDSCGL